MLIFVVRFEQVKPDAVMLFASAGGSLVEKGLMGRYAQFRGVPALMFPRGGRILHYCDTPGLRRLIARFALGKADRILCQGEQWQVFVAQKLVRPAHVAPLVRNWTATPQFLSVGEERKRNVLSGTPRLLFVGWMDRGKGVMELLAALARLSSELRPKLELVGEGDVSAVARKYVEEHGLREQVEFRGWLVGDDLISAYRAAEVFVLPSWYEGLPNAMIEAMAARLAVIVSNVGNIPSVIVDGDNGLLIPPKNVDALVDALRRVLTDSDLRFRVADRGYVVASEEFGVESAVRKITGIIEEVTDVPVCSD